MVRRGAGVFGWYRLVAWGPTGALGTRRVEIVAGSMGWRPVGVGGRAGRIGSRSLGMTGGNGRSQGFPPAGARRRG